MIKEILRRARGWFGNALVWGVGWSLVTIPVVGFLLLSKADYFALGLAPRIAGTLFSMGFLAGGTFSTYLGLTHRNKSLLELSPIRFAVVGGIFSALLLPLFKLIPGIAIFLGASFSEAMTMGAILAAGLGATTAFSTVKVAQAASIESSEGRKEVEEKESGFLPSGAG